MREKKNYIDGIYSVTDTYNMSALCSELTYSNSYYFTY